MKIGWTPGPLLPRNLSKRGQVEKANTEFKEIMKESLGKEGKTSRAALQPNPSPTAPLSRLEIGQVPGGMPQKNTVILEIEDLLDKVDFYVERLGDTSFPVKDLAPLINHLEERASALMDYSATGKLPAELGQIVSDLAVTISAEVEKFKRGDYI